MTQEDRPQPAADEHAAASQHSTKKGSRLSRRLGVVLLGLFAASLAAIWGLGSHYLHQLNPLARQEALDTLTAVTDLKASQIDRWLMERRADAALVHHTPYVARRAIDTLTRLKSATTRRMFTGWLDPFMAGEPYTRALLLDSQLHMRLVHPEDASAQLCERTRHLAGKAVERRYAVLSDLHRPPDGGAIHMDLLIPFVTRREGKKYRVPPAGAPPSTEQRTDAMLIFQVNAADFLFPLLRSWPTPSASAETFLVQRDGGDCLYLSDVRHRAGAAMALRVPLTSTDRAAVKIALGQEGISDGLDYRGVPVLVAARPIPGTTWFLVAKIDLDEVYAPLLRQARYVWIGMGLLAVVAFLGVALVWRRREAESLRDMLAGERERLVLAERIRQLMKGAHEVILLTDQDLRIVEANDRAVESYGVPLEELLRMRLPDLSAPAEEETLSFALKQAEVEDGAVFRSAHQRQDGTTFPIDGSLRLVEVDGAQYHLAIFRDVTEREELQAQLLQAQKLESIGTLAGGVAHEINNPINGIMNYAQLIQDSLEGSNQRVHGFAHEIGQEAERVADLVRNLLRFSRPEGTGKRDARLCNIVAATLSLTRTIMRHDRIALDLDVPEELPQIHCRGQQIQQVILNLLTNARDALNERYPGHDDDKRIQVTGCEIVISGRRWLRLTVEDHGAGIGAAVQERIFDPFFTTKRPDRGTGLGLSISYGIVQDHGGMMSVESREGEYTRFHVDLPVDEGGDE
ncbi:MAG: PAS domain S-box protein [Lentisphaerae bacterium]|nr:PAS domain S-box protein [Lentisphaerota bacterium]MBT4817399.1 PAS domain S-box protein [Lentisphaerota bacterium]MBT5612159.1 PAS domain S-box protein [Lentisphaerota bacterium]MBT7061086.1 PAS domain S-box protein [Lentisphaerota bacterium]MBT7843415.1 PAS domain S-box protein [Lentisphaerota bacterium]